MKRNEKKKQTNGPVREHEFVQVNETNEKKKRNRHMHRKVSNGRMYTKVRYGHTNRPFKKTEINLSLKIGKNIKQ